MICKWHNVCPLRRFETQGKINDYWKNKYCKSNDNWKNCARYKAEEKGICHSDNLMPDGSFIKDL